VRLVLDTNVVVAALLWNGTPRRLLNQAIDDATLSLYSSPTLIDELAQTLQYPKFARRISLYATTPAALVAQYAALVTLRSPTKVPRVIEHDADDDHVLAAAAAAHAHLLVSGDRKHLLSLGQHVGIAIVTPAEALRRINAPT
jgi:uncharacterized protein